MNILHDEHGVILPNSMTSSLLRVGRVSLVVSFLVPLPSLRKILAQFCLVFTKPLKKKNMKLSRDGEKKVD